VVHQPGPLPSPGAAVAGVIAAPRSSAARARSGPIASRACRRPSVRSCTRSGQSSHGGLADGGPRRPCRDGLRPAPGCRAQVHAQAKAVEQQNAGAGPRIHLHGPGEMRRGPGRPPGGKIHERHDLQAVTQVIQGPRPAGPRSGHRRHTARRPQPHRSCRRPVRPSGPGRRPSATLGTTLSHRISRGPGTPPPGAQGRARPRHSRGPGRRGSVAACSWPRRCGPATRRTRRARSTGPARTARPGPAGSRGVTPVASTASPAGAWPAVRLGALASKLNAPPTSPGLNPAPRRRPSGHPAQARERPRSRRSRLRRRPAREPCSRRSPRAGHRSAWPLCPGCGAPRRAG
jgi:hypothetical protein